MTYQHLSYDERLERTQALIDEYRIGNLTEPVFRASLYGLKYRGEELACLVREQEQWKYDHRRDPKS